MYAIFMTIIAIPIAIAVVIGTLVALIFIAGKVTNALGKTRPHPKFGEMRYVMGLWTYHAPVGGKAKVEINVPGNRKEPSAKAEALVEKIIAGWPQYESQFLDAFAAEILEQFGEEDLPEVVTLARGSDRRALLAHTELDNISVEQSENGRIVSAHIAFLHAWDPEHTRSLVVNGKGEVEDYGLTVGL